MGSRLGDKVVIVTGGDTGIGKAISVAMAREGASVVIDYVGDGAPASEVVHEVESFGARACAVGADVSKSDEVVQLIGAAVDKFGKVDVMVNNAGIE